MESRDVPRRRTDRHIDIYTDRHDATKSLFTSLGKRLKTLAGKNTHKAKFAIILNVVCL
jgi:hypothetical protein